MIIESTSAGPANCAAAVPVSTKIPVPMMAPMPSIVRSAGPRVRRNVFSDASRCSAVMLFLLSQAIA